MKKAITLFITAFSILTGMAQSKLTPDMAYNGYMAVKNLKGKPAPILKGLLLNDKAVDITQFKDSVIVLSIWNVNCAPCINELNSFKNFKTAYKGKKVVFLALNPIDTKKEIKTFLKKHPLDFTVIDSPSANVVSDYKITAYPTNYVIDSEGNICYARQGFSDNGYQLIDDVLKVRL